MLLTCYPQTSPLNPDAGKKLPPAGLFAPLTGYYAIRYPVLPWVHMCCIVKNLSDYNPYIVYSFVLSIRCIQLLRTRLVYMTSIKYRF